MKRFQIKTETEVQEESLQAKALLKVKVFKEKNEPLIELLDRKKFVLTTYKKGRYDNNYMVSQLKVIKESIQEKTQEQPPVELDPKQE